MKRILLYITLLVASNGDWELTWEPHPDNLYVIAVTECGTPRSFTAYNQQDIAPGQTSATFRHVPTPPGESCWVFAQILRRQSPDDVVGVGGEYNVAAQVD